MKSERFLVAVAALLVTGMPPADASAKNKSRSQRGNHSSSRSYRSGRSPQAAAAQAYANVTRAAAARAAAVRAAQAEVSRAGRALGSARTLVKREFEFSSEMSAALADHKQAEASYEQARRPILERVAKDPDYQAVLRTFDPILEMLEGKPRMDMVAASDRRGAH